MGRHAAQPFLNDDMLVESTAKRCAKNDIAVDTETVRNVINMCFNVLFDRAASPKRDVGEYFQNRLFKMVIKERDERMHRNPKKGLAVAKGSSRVVKFYMSSDLDKMMEDTYRKAPSKALRLAEMEKNGVPIPTEDPAAKKGGKKKVPFGKSTSAPKVDEE